MTLFDEQVPMAPMPAMHPALPCDAMASVSLSDLGLVPPRPDVAPAGLAATLGVATAPTPLEGARILAVSPTAAALLGTTAEAIAGSESWRRLLSGEACLAGMPPVATAYAGHQFGIGVPRLGDGRAHNLGRIASWELQLKGAGPTPFSRGADGRAVLRSSIREFLVSEYLHGLGVPSTRALALVGSRSHAIRETVEPAAIVCRMAPSFLRFGHIEWLARTEGMDGPGLAEVLNHRSPEDFIAEAAERTGRLMGLWLAEGFVHGVMNTDNLSPLGITLDHGPFAFLDGFDAMAVYNHSDGQGRYAFARQPQAALWSLGRLAVALGLPRRGYTEEDLRGHFEPAVQQSFEGRMSAKLGLPEGAPHATGASPPSTTGTIDPIASIDAVLNPLFAWAQAFGVDLQRFLRAWAEAGGPAHLTPPMQRVLEESPSAQKDPQGAAQGFTAWRSLLPETIDAARSLSALPAWGLRTWVLEEIIRSVEDRGELGLLNAALLGCANPFDIGTAPGAEHRSRWSGPPPDHSRHIALSCSS